ncbi:MAG: hypothetical protein LKH33_00135 [Acetobacter sp.]|nr:hypothetical protein [Acetobacter sp.]MCH4062537.1 hypothetical protein [Acetobacter sp.]MCH4088617.1 hypothetical protein [Acetobacter sp.]MCI1292523.1 hypothetical protein [Acetobacter sp.]MCI1319379.1 hypothetical protein [Acetobacter sp.]
MWKEPYLETCCRSALHRLCLSEPSGRPEGLRDEPCLRRLTGMKLAEHRGDHRFHVTSEGIERHRSEILGMARRRA